MRSLNQHSIWELRGLLFHPDSHLVYQQLIMSLELF
jgi:hypothetical protein